MRVRFLLAALALGAGAASPALAADGLTLTAAAGLEGVVRPGRWAPVTVTLDTRTADVDGELVVTWGDRQIRRAVRVAAPSRTTVAIFARTTDVRDAMTLHLDAGGARLDTLEIPVRVVGGSETFTACIGAADADTPCGVILDPSALPVSPRALDAADTITVAVDAVLTPAQYESIRLWRAVRHVDQVGNAAPATGAVPPPAGLARQALPPTLGYLLLILTAAIAVGVVRRRALAMAALPAAIAVGTVATAFAGAGRPVVIHHASIVEAFSGVEGARVTTRGIAEYPAKRGALTIAACDGAIDVRSPSYELEPQRFGEDGCPRLDGPAQLGSARPFQLEAFAAVHLLDARLVDGRWRVTNVSGSPLRDCDLPDGFPDRRIDELAAGAAIDAVATLVADDPVVSCRLDAAPVPMFDRHGAVRFNGTTIVALHLLPAGVVP